MKQYCEIFLHLSNLVSLPSDIGFAVLQLRTCRPAAGAHCLENPLEFRNAGEF